VNNISYRWLVISDVLSLLGALAVLAFAIHVDSFWGIFFALASLVCFLAKMGGCVRGWVGKNEGRGL